jgi:hypothetical protein
MNANKFLVLFLKFSGLFELSVAILFLFMPQILTSLFIPNAGFFELFSGITFATVGFLLYYSARDVARFLVIPVTSCVYRYVVALAEIYGALTIPAFLPMFVFGCCYDVFSATLTLWLLKKCGHFAQKESRK